MTVDRFITKHLINIENNCKLFRSEQIKNNTEEIKMLETSTDNKINIQSEEDEVNNDFTYVNKNSIFDIKNMVPTETHQYGTESEDEIFANIDNCENNVLNVVENWKGRGENEDIEPLHKVGTKKKRITKYMSPTPEIDMILNKKTRSQSNTLFLNGNMTICLRVSNKIYIIHNTCPFDAVAAVITMAYIDYPQYRDFVDCNKNIFLKFCKQLAVNGTSKQIYKERLQILKGIFKEVDGVTEIKLIDARCNVLYLVTKLFVNAPSAIEYVNCSNKNCPYFNIERNSATVIVRLENGIQSLEDSLLNYTLTKSTNCYESECNGTVETNRIFQQHIFVETDILGDNEEFSLMDFPTTLFIHNTR